MARLDCTTETVAGVTLVSLHLASDAPERVTVERTHEAPIWPPRRQGVPERGWDADGWTGVVRPDDPRSLGYATPTDPPEPPVHVNETEPDPAAIERAEPRDVLRSLGDPRPPRDAVDPSVETATAAADRDVDPGDADEPTVSSHDGPALDAIAARLDRAEELARISSVEEAGRIVEDAGGIEAVRELVAQLERDRAALADLHERTTRLRDRATVEVPVDDLARLV